MAHKIVTAEQMQNIDREAIEKCGIDGLELMERAGEAVADCTQLFYEDVECVGIVTGKGNNAGDGLVVARILAEQGLHVKVLMLVEAQNLSESGRANFDLLPKQVEFFSRQALPDMEEIFYDCDVVIDAILGTGIKGAPKGLLGEAISRMNELDLPIVAVDVPSGLNATSGKAEGACIKADLTVTMGAPKTGLLFGEGSRFAGRVEVVDIGIPKRLLENPDYHEHLLCIEDALGALKPRPQDSHKGTFGSVLVLGGGVGMGGAVALTARMALRSGCGMVYTALPAEVEKTIGSSILESVKIPVTTEHGRFLTHDCWGELESILEKVDALAFGPGLGTHPATARLVDELVCLDIPMVVDADALNCLGEKALLLTENPAPCILTPHPGEMARILGCSVYDVQQDRVGAARKLATEGRVVVVLKGFHTVIADPEGNAYINPTGNNGMAKGGMGDVLTGLIGGLLAQGVPYVEAATAGVYLHGLGGDRAAEANGTRGMTAEDVIEGVVRYHDIFEPHADLF